VVKHPSTSKRGQERERTLEARENVAVGKGRAFQQEQEPAMFGRTLLPTQRRERGGERRGECLS
jgi:hypothetical protein